MSYLHFIVAGDLTTRTGGYVYDARIIEGLRGQGWEVRVHCLANSFPTPDERALEQAARCLASLPASSLVVIDGLALGGMPGLVTEQAERLRLLGLVHHPLALETGLSQPEQTRLFQQERDALAAVERVIVTSPSTVHPLDAYGVSAARIGVVVPGTDPAPLAAGSSDATVAFLCVATLTPRKGHELLIEALAALSDRDWRLRCVGSLTRDPVTADRVRARIIAAGLNERVELVGETQGKELDQYYHHADVFVLPSYYEGYGMALAEASARGLPVVSTTAGAIPATVPAEAGLLAPPGDPVALQHALRRVLDDHELRQRLAAGARRARHQLPDWATAAKRFAQQLRSI